ncbi:DUF4276 family protein [Elizabethkingia meningoseptica]|uniref:DUF4276 family protein n=1 Tax=Elizabethkingia meningoseptica TaxID=238 RepID=UPI002DD63A25|nr:DUF4276 family protein [Elizabethkingia meningoseptica]MEC4710395.1 DUF4276 family protein [Elizabethkingia meningoseptica]
MKILIIIVEGQTEKEFVQKTLRNYFHSLGIYDVRAIMIQTSKGHKGGLVNYDHLKNDIDRILKSEKAVIVSTFVDFFRIPSNFPGYGLSLSKTNVDLKIEVLEEGMRRDINDDRFVPYIQKHEFEALLFSSDRGFSNWFDDIGIIADLTTIVNKYSNPEEINTGIDTAPSKRIIKILGSKNKKYDKIAEGNLIAEEIGIQRILEKCPNFKKWIELLIIKLKEN